MNEDLYSSTIDDDLFDDQPGQTTVTQPVQPQQGVMTPGGPEPPVTTPQMNAGNADDNDIIGRLNDRISSNAGQQGDYLSTYLKSAGIDPDNIQIMDEDGTPSYVNFSQLSDSDKLDLLNSTRNTGQDTSNQEDDLDDDEIDLINSIRKSRMSINDFMDAIRQDAVNRYMQSGANQYMSVDQVSDDDLYLSDFKSKVPNATAEDAAASLQAAKSNPEVYKRMIDGMRQAYKQQEEEFHQQQIEQSEAELKRRQEEYEDVIVNAVEGISRMKLGELTSSLSNDDKEDIASAILDSDVAGNRYLAQMINDPETLTRMVWYALKGEEAIDQMQRYYKNEINTRQQAAYKKGFEDAKNGKGMSYVVQKPAGNKRQNKPLFTPVASLEDIDAGLD